MDHKDEVEMSNLHAYLNRVQKGQVSGAEPFHVITTLYGKMPKIALTEARALLVRQSPKASSLMIEDLIRTTPTKTLIEVSMIFSEQRLCQIGEIDQMEQDRHPCCHDRHLRVIEGGGITEPAEAGELPSRHFQVV